MRKTIPITSITNFRNWHEDEAAAAAMALVACVLYRSERHCQREST